MLSVWHMNAKAHREVGLKRLCSYARGEIIKCIPWVKDMQLDMKLCRWELSRWEIDKKEWEIESAGFYNMQTPGSILLKLTNSHKCFSKLG